MLYISALIKAALVVDGAVCMLRVCYCMGAACGISVCGSHLHAPTHPHTHARMQAVHPAAHRSVSSSHIYFVIFHLHLPSKAATSILYSCLPPQSPNPRCPSTSSIPMSHLDLPWSLEYISSLRGTLFLYVPHTHTCAPALGYSARCMLRVFHVGSPACNAQPQASSRQQAAGSKQHVRMQAACHRRAG